MGNTIAGKIREYNNAGDPEEKAICESLATEITKYLAEAENKVWHAHPVWFLDGNPIVGYSREKAGIRLMFWSGASPMPCLFLKSVNQ